MSDPLHDVWAALPPAARSARGTRAVLEAARRELAETERAASVRLAGVRRELTAAEERARRAEHERDRARTRAADLEKIYRGPRSTSVDDEKITFQIDHPGREDDRKKFWPLADLEGTLAELRVHGAEDSTRIYLGDYRLVAELPHVGLLPSTRKRSAGTLEVSGQVEDDLRRWQTLKDRRAVHVGIMVYSGIASLALTIGLLIEWLT